MFPPTFIYQNPFNCKTNILIIFILSKDGIGVFLIFFYKQYGKNALGEDNLKRIILVLHYLTTLFETLLLYYSKLLFLIR